MTHRGPFQPLPFCDSVIVTPRTAQLIFMKTLLFSHCACSLLFLPAPSSAKPSHHPCSDPRRACCCARGSDADRANADRRGSVGLRALRRSRSDGGDVFSSRGLEISHINFSYLTASCFQVPDPEFDAPVPYDSLSSTFSLLYAASLRLLHLPLTQPAMQTDCCAA